MDTINDVQIESQVPLCKRCKEASATVKMRAEMVCATCFSHFIAGKTIKRMEVLNRETRPNWADARIMLMGLSFGPSSTAMVNVLHQNYQRHEKKKKKGGVTEYTAAHVDTSLSSPMPSTEARTLLEKYNARFPDITMSIIPLTNILKLRDTVDWSALPALNPGLASEPEKQLQDMFSRLPSTTSKADILRLFVRHLLLAEAVERKCSTLLLGHTTTALAETTLSEAAKGRGFAVPWLVADGSVSVPASTATTTTTTTTTITTTTTTTTATTSLDPSSEATTREMISLPIYYPMRDVFRKEVVLYNKSTSPPLADLVPESFQAGNRSGGGGAVVSHKTIAIEEVMGRFFEDVEENYPSIVANVVRTSAKLVRVGLGGGGADGNADAEDGDKSSREMCGLCGLGLDEKGDERWRGEIGDDREKMVTKRPLCYGCDRSVRG